MPSDMSPHERLDDLLNNELMKTVLAARIDAMWSTINLEELGRPPKLKDEGSVGEHDAHGALFVPAGFVYKDTDGRPIELTPYTDKTPAAFREAILLAMKEDCAIPIGHEGIASGVHIHGDVHEFARLIAANHIVTPNTTQMPRKRPDPISVGSIVKSTAPWEVKPPHGSRTKVGAAVYVCMTHPVTYYHHLIEKNSITKPEDLDALFNRMTRAQQPIMADDGSTVLARPHLISCHQTRYYPNNYCGITRIMGYDGFGAFGLVTIEKVRADLKNKAGVDEIPPDKVLAQHGKDQYVGVLRLYPATTLGRRSYANHTLLIPFEQLGIDTAAINKESIGRYKISPA